MKAFFSSLWLRSKKHLMITWIVIAIIMVALIITLILIGYVFNGTGFNGGYQITTSRVISGPSSGTVTQIEVYQPGKTLWDWLQLLIVPAVLAIGGSIISITTSKSEREAAKQRDITERAIAVDGQQEAALQAYLDIMSELLLEKDLRQPKPTDEIHKVARVRTLTVLSRLDNERKRSLLQFLQEARLIDSTRPIVLLDGADLSEANLSGVNLNRANLSRTNLGEADLSEANLRNADLRGAYVRGADLSGADLSEANLRNADLRGAYVRGADLNRAYMSGADLSGADLSGADLSGADLSGAIITKDQLDRATNIMGIKVSASS